ncbi:unnamed protein product [Cyprideis torosa]|uniref:Uncharacterized protein n=1 Tax=Cyprideis torosa TaxID=163714 RepID=A0A7R8WD93_9CRUS|nr:unnamed protein product [Cyprideis torosa]CAG0889205.1 unnamed protein product [Cyprideis torosa]
MLMDDHELKFTMSSTGLFCQSCGSFLPRSFGSEVRTCNVCKFRNPFASEGAVKSYTVYFNCDSRGKKPSKKSDEIEDGPLVDRVLPTMGSILGSLPPWLLGAVGGVSALILLKGYVLPSFNRYQSREYLKGKTVLITGANTGIGKETALDLARRGGRVIMACRDLKKCKKAREEIILSTGNQHVVARECDLASFDSIRKFAERINQEEPQLNILINNAGVMRPPKSLTKDGLELQMGTNHFGHFLLTNLLLDKIKASAPSRIIVVSSVGHKRGRIDFDDLNADKEYDARQVYCNSKLANNLFSNELARRLSGSGVTVNCLHPGIVRTELGRHMSLYKSKWSWFFVYPLVWILLKSPEEGAQTTIRLAVDKTLEKTTGRYFSDQKEVPQADQAYDEAVAKRLWDVSEIWTRLKEFKSTVSSNK